MRLIIIVSLLMMVMGLSSGERHEVNFNEGQFAFGWEIKEEEGKIEIDCLGETLGYVGIGFNPKNGKMDKAEMAIGGVTDEDGQPYHGIYIGRHHKVKVHKKGRKQWELLEARQNDTHTFVKYSRHLSSKRRLSELEMMKNNLIPGIDCSIENDQQHQHTQDNLQHQQYQTNHTIESRSSSSSDIIPIKDKPLYVIWALGKSDKIKKHHGHGQYKVNLINPEIPIATAITEEYYYKYVYATL